MRSQIPVFTLALFLVIFSNTLTYSQFKDAAVLDVAVGMVPVTANNTGNAILDSGGNTYLVTVWDDNAGNNSGLAWQVGLNTGFTSIDPTTVVVDPDVCLVKNAVGTVYAIVVYYDQNNNQFMMRIFNWVAATQQFNGNTPVMLSPGQYETAINADANDTGDFAIVWDQPGQLIQLTFGSTSGGGVPQLTFPGSAFNIESGTMPDVCFYRSATTNYKQVDVVYINPGSFVTVDFYRFNDLLSGVIAYLPNFRSAAADLIYKYPRIDCPAPPFGDMNSFTVVVEDSDNSSSWYIKSFNSNNCCPGYTTTIYNDGSTGNSPYNLTDVSNTRPVVAYQNNTDGINVGWNFDNSFGLLGAPGASVARYPIAMSCDKRAQVHAASSYLVVPVGITYGSQIGNLSMSGRLSASGIYSYLNSNSNDIYYKSVPHAVNAGSLRTENFTTLDQWLYELSLSDKVRNDIELTAYDMLGKKVFSVTGTPEVLKSKWIGFTESAPAGMYVAQSAIPDNMSSYTGKIFIGQ